MENKENKSLPEDDLKTKMMKAIAPYCNPKNNAVDMLSAASSCEKIAIQFLTKNEMNYVTAKNAVDFMMGYGVVQEDFENSDFEHGFGSIVTMMRLFAESYHQHRLAEVEKEGKENAVELLEFIRENSLTFSSTQSGWFEYNGEEFAQTDSELFELFLTQKRK